MFLQFFTINFRLNFLSQEEAQVFSGWMNKALDFVCGRIAWPCEMPDYPQQTAQKQVEPLRSVPQQTVYERNQETHDNMVINQYHSEIRPGAQYSHEQKPSGQPSNTESGKSSQCGQGGLIENGLSVQSSQGYQSNQSRHSANSAHSTHSSHSSTQSGQRVGSGQIEAHLSQLSLSNRPVTINTGYNLPTSTITANNSLLTEIRTGTNLRPVNQNGNPPRAQPTGPNFNDELKRRLADRQGRKIESPAGPEKNQRVDSSDYSSEPSPDVADKSQKLASGQVDEIRRAIRSELSQFRTELFSQFRDVIRSEIRNLQADSNH